MEFIKVVHTKEQMIEIGRRIVAERQDIYTPLMLEKIMKRIVREFPDKESTFCEEVLYSSIYDYWVYGNNIDEEFFYHFYEKTHEEKKSYMTDRVLGIYANYLNCGDAYVSSAERKKRADLLDMKYECYKLLKPYYKREIIEIKNESDLGLFEEYVSRHPVFVAKPSDFSFGTGVHKVDINDFPTVRDAFLSLLSEGKQINKRHPSHQTSVVLEEVIDQIDELTALHPASVNAVRATAIRDKNGKMVIAHPWIKVAIGGQFVSSAVYAGFDAEIDGETGVVISDGYSENGRIYQTHPDTGIPIKGFVIPQWDELKVFVEEVMSKLPDYRYAGLDLVLTKNGWCVMEINYQGECMWQLIQGKGCREEIEELIGWKMDKEFWWQIRPFHITKKS